MERSTDRILTTHCGLLPPPSLMGDLMAAKAAGQTDQAMDLITRGVAETLSRQAEIGIDVRSDGEFYKNAFTDYEYYASRVEGLDHREAGDDQVWFGDKRSPEMLQPRFQRFFEFADRVGMFPSSGWKIPFSHRFVIAEPLRYRGPESINRELAAVSEGLEAAGLRPQDVFYPSSPRAGSGTSCGTRPTRPTRSTCTASPMRGRASTRRSSARGSTSRSTIPPSRTSTTCSTRP